MTYPPPTIIIVEVGASCSRQAALPDLTSCYEVTLCQEKFPFGHNCFLKVSGKSLVEQSPALATLLFVDQDIVLPTVQWFAESPAI